MAASNSVKAVNFSSTLATLSRSTSAGSIGSEEETTLGKTSSYPSQSNSCSQMPDYDYPTPIFVKNTFIDTPLDRPESLDGFLHERRIQSCPVETPIVEEDESDDVDDSIAPMRLRRAATAGAAAIAAAAADTAAAMMEWWHGGTPQDQQQQPVSQWHEPGFALPVHHQDFQQPPAFSYDMAAAEQPFMPPPTAAPVLLLSEALAPPSSAVLGTPECPTMGSMEHFTGNCKPCAFFHKRGCSNGVQCSFCHLCDSSEKKRRQKEKVQQLREMRRQGITPP